MKRKLWVTLIVVFWLGATGWLIVFEAFPGLWQQTAAGYRSLLSPGLLVLDQWMKVAFHGAPIGYSHTAVDVNDKNPLQQYTLNNRTLLTLNIMGEEQKVSVTIKAEIDAFYSLQQFLFILSSSGYSVSLTGKRIKGGDFEVITRTGGSTQRSRVTIPEDAVLYSPLTEMTLKSLRPGQQARLRTFNPLSLSTDEVLVKALRRETLRHRGRDYPTTVLSSSTLGMESLSWMAADGQVLRQETPMGWTMEACDAQEALAVIPADAGDLLKAMAVPFSGTLAEPRATPRFRFRLLGATLDRETLATHRQIVNSLTGTVADITVSADTLPASGRPLAEPQPVDPADLAATPYIQAHDPALVKQAREIVGDAGDSLQAALAIYHWVHKHVVKKPTVSLPSAVDVLRHLEGDCNEHTYLFVGLARAAGIPARIRVGLTFSDGLFYYHAWPSVYVGRWLDMDPTLGQPAVDATHISLFAGEIREQMKLMAVLGRLRVEQAAAPAGANGAP